MRPRQKTRLIKALADPEYRHAFFGSLISTSIAAQLRANRKHRGLSQSQLGDRAGMLQSRISALEDVNYQRWTIKTLKRLAEALDLVLSVRFESFGKALRRLENFQESLVEPPFDEDFEIHGHGVGVLVDHQWAMEDFSTTETATLPPQAPPGLTASSRAFWIPSGELAGTALAADARDRPGSAPLLSIENDMMKVYHA